MGQNHRLQLYVGNENDRLSAFTRVGAKVPQCTGTFNILIHLTSFKYIFKKNILGLQHVPDTVSMGAI